MANFEMTHDEPNLKIYQHTILERRIKMVGIFDRNKYSK